MFIIHDLTDVITVERIGTGPTLFSPTGHFLPNPGVAESTTFTLSRNDGTRIVSPSNVASGIDYGILIVGPGEPPPPLGIGSDLLAWVGLLGEPCALGDFTCSVSFGFSSALDIIPQGGVGFPGFLYNQVGTMIEDGSVQTALNLVWSDGTVDMIGFQSDVEPIPEPSTVVLLLSGVALLSIPMSRLSRNRM